MTSITPTTDSPSQTAASPWLTAQEAAEYAKVSTRTIYVECRAHRLRHARIGGRRDLRLLAVWIDQWLERWASPVEIRHP